MPIWGWGIVVMFAGLIVMISSIFLASSDQNTKFSKLITFGGFCRLFFIFDDQCKYLSLNQLVNHCTYGANVSNRFCCVLCWRCWTYMPDENKYVLRHEWIDSNGKFMKKSMRTIEKILKL